MVASGRVFAASTPSGAGICPAATVPGPGAMDSKSGIAPAVDTLFVWDFDWTIVNCNSDKYVPSKFLGNAESEQKLRRLYRDLGPGKWHECVSSLVNSCVEEKGCSRQDVIEAVASMPCLVDVEGSVRNVAARAGCSQMIISDGNDEFIGAFLDGTGLGRCFDRGVETNFATWSAGRFGVRHQSSKYSGHSSPSCPPNLCKSQVLRDVLGVMGGGRPRVVCARDVYVGDGSGDFCPCLRLRAGDTVCARSGFPLAKKLEAMKDDAKVLDARVAYWEDGAELARALRAAAN